ncbi:MAG: 3'(2'),5'-bisphosphate nucleotidase CysQ [Pseudaminobacter sp.]|nr:3'(2'),5'-bisphosphate nucleotidase CysQ [Pseudaminobacter sp.]
MSYFKQSQEVWMKGGQSPVSEADYAADLYLRETLLAARPDYGWLSEETADTAERLSARRLFVVDPIDGTRGFLEGNSAWCVSVAIVEAGKPVAGVLECPARAETFSAVAGKGAQKNGVALHVRPAGPAPYVGGPRPMIDRTPAKWRETFHRIAYVPSLAYRIAMIADGVIDATFVKGHAQDWDLAAADLILGEAGGGILNADGSAPIYGRATTSHGPLAAGSGELLRVMAQTLTAGA